MRIRVDLLALHENKVVRLKGHTLTIAIVNRNKHLPFFHPKVIRIPFCRGFQTPDREKYVLDSFQFHGSTYPLIFTLSEPHCMRSTSRKIRNRKITSFVLLADPVFTRLHLLCRSEGTAHHQLIQNVRDIRWTVAQIVLEPPFNRAEMCRRDISA